MNWIIAIILGGIVGWVASIIMKTNAQMGILANIVVGIVGSMLGLWIAGAAGLAPGGGIMGFLVALVGALVLIFILRALGLFK